MTVSLIQIITMLAQIIYIVALVSAAQAVIVNGAAAIPVSHRAVQLAPGALPPMATSATPALASHTAQGL